MSAVTNSSTKGTVRLRKTSHSVIGEYASHQWLTCLSRVTTEERLFLLGMTRGGMLTVDAIIQFVFNCFHIRDMLGVSVDASVVRMAVWLFLCAPCVCVCVCVCVCKVPGFGCVWRDH